MVHSSNSGDYEWGQQQVVRACGRTDQDDQIGLDVTSTSNARVVRTPIGAPACAARIPIGVPTRAARNPIGAPFFAARNPIGAKPHCTSTLEELMHKNGVDEAWTMLEEMLCRGVTTNKKNRLPNAHENHWRWPITVDSITCVPRNHVG